MATRRNVPVFGIVLALLGTAVQCIGVGLLAYELMTRGNPVGLLLVAVVLAPATAAIVGGARDMPTLQRMGVWTLGFMSVGWLVVGIGFLLSYASPNNSATLPGLGLLAGLAGVGLGVALGLGTLSLKDPW